MELERMAQVATLRIAVTPQVQKLIQDLANGLNAKQYEAIEFAIRKLAAEDPDVLLAAYKLRPEFEEARHKEPA
jgi:hypothetical protein